MIGPMPLTTNLKAHEAKGNSSVKRRRYDQITKDSLLGDFLENEMDRNFDWTIQYFKLFDRILLEKKFHMHKRNGNKTFVEYRKDDMVLAIIVTAYTINKLPSRLNIKLLSKFGSHKWLAKSFLFEKGKNISPKKDLHCFLNHCIKEYKINCSKSIIES